MFSFYASVLRKTILQPHSRYRATLPLQSPTTLATYSSTSSVIVSIWQSNNRNTLLLLLPKQQQVQRRHRSSDIRTHGTYHHHHHHYNDNAAREKVFQATQRISELALLGSSGSNSSNDDAVKEAERIVQHLKQDPSTRNHLNMLVYNSLLSVYAKSGRRDAVERARELLLEMEQDFGIRPTTIILNTVLDIWAKSTIKNGAYECERIIQRMKDQVAQEGNFTVAPDIVTYNTLIAAYANRGMAQEAEQVLLGLLLPNQHHHHHQQHGSSSSSSTIIAPDLLSFNTVMNAWAKRGTVGAAERVEAIWNKLRVYAKSVQNPSLQPDQVTYGIVLDAWARSTLSFSAGQQTRKQLHKVGKHADRILKAMRKDPNVTPNRITYNSIMTVWSRIGGKMGVERAEEYFAEMKAQHNENQAKNKDDDSCQPSQEEFNVMMTAWANAGMGHQGPQKAEEYFEQMKHRWIEQGDERFRPRAIDYNAIITAFAKTILTSKSGVSSLRESNVAAAQAAERYFHEMISEYQDHGNASCRPTVFVYNVMMTLWARIGGETGVINAEQYFRQLSERYHLHGDEWCKPRNNEYNVMMLAWKNCGSPPHAAANAERYFIELKEQWQKTNGNDESLKVRLIDYFGIMTALARGGTVECAERADHYFDEMMNQYRVGGDESLRPTRMEYNTMISAWGRSQGGSQGLAQAERYFAAMKHQWKEEGNEHCQPHINDYNVMLDTLAKSHDYKNSIYRATELMEELKQIANSAAETGQDNHGCEPDRLTYAVYLCILARSPLADKATRAWDVIGEMDDRGMEVNMMDLNEVLLACATSRNATDRNVVFQVARNAYDRLHESRRRHHHGDENQTNNRKFRADSRSYERFFVAAQGATLDPSSLAAIDKAWYECQRNGHDGHPRVRNAWEMIRHHHDDQ